MTKKMKSRKQIAMENTYCACGKTIANHTDEEVRNCLRRA